MEILIFLSNNKLLTGIIATGILVTIQFLRGGYKRENSKSAGKK
jgi:hypothetical protein